ncbi:hypothetical protein [Salinisphaera orenii]|uniref:Uncharacterized protein n=1 Tax=Salinisphaera orenii YIM 95161 TaxID=1051139 RepID=A0A423PMH8_9GAMM|nr:hypothetical protein [Salinisphaera halophila]ROO26787.1 hypothetical protein SAHL_12740 [Salinisphaera halophila YIM 95161]
MIKLFDRTQLAVAAIALSAVAAPALAGQGNAAETMVPASSSQASMLRDVSDSSTSDDAEPGHADVPATRSQMQVLEHGQDNGNLRRAVAQK